MSKRSPRICFRSSLIEVDLMRREFVVGDCSGEEEDMVVIVVYRGMLYQLSVVSGCCIVRCLTEMLMYYVSRSIASNRLFVVCFSCTNCSTKRRLLASLFHFSPLRLWHRFYDRVLLKCPVGRNHAARPSTPTTSTMPTRMKSRTPFHCTRGILHSLSSMHT